VNVCVQAAGWPRAERTSDGVEYRVRPLCRNDIALEREFILGLSPESRFQRFMHAIGAPSAEFIAHLVDVDPHSRMALVAVIGALQAERFIGVARYAADADGRDCEFAVAVGDAWQCRGVGTTLVRLLFEHAKRAGFRSIYGHVLADNQRMIELAEWLGLRLEPTEPHRPIVRASLRLN
jgi:acetyltransferase